MVPHWQLGKLFDCFYLCVCKCVSVNASVLVEAKEDTRSPGTVVIEAYRPHNWVLRI